MMINADMALVRDLGVGGLTDSKANCVFRLGTPRSCPLATTLTKVERYRDNNTEWVTDFQKVLKVMIDKGLDPKV